jgi:hypothetical protein
MVDLTGHIPTADNPVSANPELNKTLNTTWTKERAARIAAAAREEARGDSFVQTFRVDRPWNQWNRFCLSNSNWAACNRAVQMVKSGRWTVQQGYESFFDVLRGQRKADQFSQAVQDFINSMGPYGAEIAVAAKALSLWAASRGLITLGEGGAAAEGISANLTGSARVARLKEFFGERWGVLARRYHGLSMGREFGSSPDSQ